MAGQTPNVLAFSDESLGTFTWTPPAQLQEFFFPEYSEERIEQEGFSPLLVEAIESEIQKMYVNILCEQIRDLCGLAYFHFAVEHLRNSHDAVRMIDKAFTIFAKEHDSASKKLLRYMMKCRSSF